MPLCADTSHDQSDDLTLLDEDGRIDPDDEVHGMDIPDCFRIQASTPAALDSSLLQRGVVVMLGMDWFGGLITRQSQQRTRHLYDYRVYLEQDQSTRSMKLQLEKYSRDPDVVVGSRVLLERNTAEQVDGATIGAVATTELVDRGGHKRST